MTSSSRLSTALVLVLCIASCTLGCNIAGVITKTFGITEWKADWGNFVHRHPLCVAFPGSAEQVAKVVKYAITNNLTIAVRGNGHSIDGQSQNEGGIVMDTTGLNILTFDDPTNPTSVTVGAGLLWEPVISACYEKGFRPITHVDTTPDLSIGGTISIGGISALITGSLAEGIEEMLVVKGTGEITKTQKGSNLFNSICGGLGQYAVIVTATFTIEPLVQLLEIPVGLTPLCNPAATDPKQVMNYYVLFGDAGSFYDGITAAIKPEAKFDGVETFIIKNDAFSVSTLLPFNDFECIHTRFPDSPLIYITALVDFKTLEADLDSVLATGGVLIEAFSQTYEEYGNRQSVVMRTLEKVQLWEKNQKQIFNVYIPLRESTRTWFMAFMGNLSFDPRFFGLASPPARTAAFVQPTMMQIPKNYDFIINPYLIYMTSNIPINPHVPGIDCLDLPLSTWELSDIDRDYVADLYDGALHAFPDLKSYPQGRPPYTWEQHYGKMWPTVVKNKKKYDPFNVLGAGIPGFLKSTIPKPTPSSCPSESQGKKYDSVIKGFFSALTFNPNVDIPTVIATCPASLLQYLAADIEFRVGGEFMSFQGEHVLDYLCTAMLPAPGNVIVKNPSTILSSASINNQVFLTVENTVSVFGAPDVAPTFNNRFTMELTFDSENKIKKMIWIYENIDAFFLYINSLVSPSIPAICGQILQLCPTAYNSNITFCEEKLSVPQMVPYGAMKGQGNNLGCRIFHLSMVPFNPTLNCPDVDLSGGQFCVDPIRSVADILKQFGLGK